MHGPGTKLIWRLLSPETRQFKPNSAQDWRTRDVIQAIFGDPSEVIDVWALLARPVQSTASYTSKTQQYKFHESSSGFNNLSNEIVDIIFSHILPNKEDALSITLAIDSQRVWQILLRRINQTSLKLAAPWAGKLLSLQCSWATKLPPLVKAQKALVEEIVLPYIGYVCEARSFFWKHSRVENPRTNDGETWEWTSALEKHLAPSEIFSKHLLAELKNPSFYPEGQWVLRNLTRREFVCTERTRTQGARKCPNLTVILMIRIMWVDTSYDMLKRLGLGKGKWAGCRFDIVTKEVFEAEKVRRWKNVTQEANAEAEVALEKYEKFKKTDRGSIS
jgi:hypothetical protein